MVSPGIFLKASLNAGREFFRPPVVEDGEPAPYRVPVMVPIRSIGPSHSERIEKHLLALDAHDRYLRFGYAASDEQIRRYSASLNYQRDEIFGIYNRRLELIAMAHLALSVDPDLTSCAEFGVSVLPHARGRGYGARLFDRAVIHARNEGVRMMFIHALSENTAMLNIARKAGAVIERDGSESEAYLKLPPADLDSRMTELVEEQIAQTDYRLKVQAMQFWDLLGLVQEVRRGVRDSRDRMPM
ncbi:MAG: GNAT family N-acetyltransferase [Pseudomonadota bacterium]|uniref:GNAT family N-acetyltransferase n=1 Tax=Polaromonas sp. TaxID=1869339 RepID=UPI00180EF695|nr:GNAT family N-acetyltransferase [Polaromonas sp.]MBA3592602.1 GNAT family N-acetyltransferase [Polaromonas sp.]MDQ3273243.1 GNAT family N-acetyltransferase [Pseudomonadota bacterium]